MPITTSKIQLLRVLNTSEEQEISSEEEIEDNKKKSNRKKVIDFISKPIKLYDLENNVLYLCWEYFNWLKDIVLQCENLFIHE